MELKKYIKFRNITIKDAAKQLGVSRQYLSDIVHKKIPAGRKLAKKINTWSENAVDIMELLYPK